MPDDVPECVEIIAKHPVLGPRYGKRIDDLQRALVQVLGRDAIRTGIIQTCEGPRHTICFFGVSAFVNDDFIREVKTPPLFWYGPELSKRILCSESPLLSDSQIREANSSGGLNLICWESCVRPGFESHDAIHRGIMSVFIEAHIGFLWKEIMTSQLDSPERLLWTIKTGGLWWDCQSGRYMESLGKDAEDIIREPHVVGVARAAELTRPEAWAGTWVGTLFDYRPPHFGFTPSEQRMLLAAIEGATDEELSQRVGTSLPTIKKTWQSVYRRAAKHMPELNLVDAESDESVRRGKEKRRRLMAYLREHFEELRPYSPKLLRKNVQAATAKSKSRSVSA